MDNFNQLTRQIHVAAEYRRMDDMINLLDQTPTLVDAISAKGTTLLHRAVWWDNYELVALLLARTANTELTHPNGNTPLNIAIYGVDATKNVNRWRIAHLLVEHGANAFTRDRNGRLPICNAIFYNEHDFVRAMVSCCPTAVNRECENGKSLLAYAVECCKPEIVQVLLDCGADPHVRLQDYETLLHTPEVIAFPEMALSLIAAGLDIETRDSSGMTALHRAAIENGGDRLTHVLLAAGANVNARDNLQATPLHHGASMKQSKQICLLLEAGADMEARSIGGDTPLMWATWYGNIEIMQLLMEHGANIHAVDDEGNTVMHRAAGHTDLAIVRLLIEAGQDVDHSSSAGVTPLLIAFTGYSPERANFFLSHTKHRNPQGGIQYTRSNLDTFFYGANNHNPRGLQREDCSISVDLCPFLRHGIMET